LVTKATGAPAVVGDGHDPGEQVAGLPIEAQRLSKPCEHDRKTSTAADRDAAWLSLGRP
jgi:hypothetical protein